MQTEEQLRELQRIVAKQQKENKPAFVEFTANTTVYPSNLKRQIVNISLDDYLVLREYHAMTYNDCTLEKLQNDVVRLSVRFVSGVMQVLGCDSILVALDKITIIK